MPLRSRIFFDENWQEIRSWIFFDQNWQRTGCHQKAGSSLNKMAKEGSKTLLVTSAFPKWIISDKQLPAPSRNGSSLISNYQLLLGTRISCSSMFLLLMIKASTWKSRGKFWSLSSKRRNGEHTSLQCKQNKLASNQKEGGMLSQNSLGEAIQLCLQDGFQLSRR